LQNKKYKYVKRGNVIAFITLIVAIIRVIIAFFQLRQGKESQNNEEIEFIKYDPTIDRKNSDTIYSSDNVANSIMNEDRKIDKKSSSKNIISLNRSNNTVKNDVAILVIKDGLNYLEISNPIAKHLISKGDIAVTNLFNKNFIKNEFKNIYSGNSFNSTLDSINLDLSNYVDQIILGELNVLETINKRGLYILDFDLKLNLYDSKTLELVEVFEFKNPATLNSNRSIAYKEGIEDIITQIKNIL